MKLDSKYSDTIERILYNGFLSGVSLSGDSFFYTNPLAIQLSDHNRFWSHSNEDHLPITKRVKVFDCSCCPPNITRIFANLEMFLYDIQNDTAIIHQYASSVLDNGVLHIEQKTNYPYDGKVSIKCNSKVKTLKLRIPNWCKKVTISAPYTMENGYAVISSPSTETQIEFFLEPYAVFGNSNIREAARKLAIGLGPIIYCLESQDNGNYPPFDFEVLYPIKAEINKNTFCNFPLLKIKGYLRKTSNSLYSYIAPEKEKVDITLIPYYAFANRKEDDMSLWLLYNEE